MSKHFLSFGLCLMATLRITAAEPEPVAFQPELVSVESSLLSDSSHIRQFAFDDNAETYFASTKNATKSDHFTFRFEKPQQLKSVTILSGLSNGANALTKGELEISTDGKEFKSVGKITQAKVQLQGKWNGIKALRIRPTEDLDHPIVLREITLDAEPKLKPFRHPIEISLEVTDAPEMKDWAENVVRICEQHYPAICDFLASEDFKPPTRLHMVFKSDYDGVAMAGGGRITGSVKYFKDHPKDIGAMIHETVHCVQSYRARRLPGWLVEGIADYVRFWKYELGKAGRLAPERAKYNASYRITGAFLAYATDKYDAKLVPKLNALLRENKYDEMVWKKLTGKTVDELNQEWKASLAK